ncbi:MAG: 8-amino-7-oxononanoate synthase [Nitrospirae bacterium]|nr:8-amino-7-oxononanoate synthase [Nitrospirota bacterium]
MFEKDLEALKRLGLFREILSLATSQGPSVRIDGREYINFSSNDYLGFAGRKELIRSAAKALREFGAGSGASRLLAGGTVLHQELEERISRYKGTDAALLFNSGYSANTGIIPAIAGAGGVIFSDELNHASIIDGCRLSRAKTLVYRHGDAAHLESLIRREKTGRRRKIVVTDSVFSMDGDIAPLSEINELCIRHNALLYIDDAHATGVLGAGRGGLAHFGISPRSGILQMGTFSKALGSFGAFVAGDRDQIAWILNTARSFIFSTALPPSVVAASIKAIELIEKDPAPLKRLWANRQRLAGALSAAGYDIMGSETPILPVRTGGIRKTLRMARFLFEEGIYAPAIRPPAVKVPRIRLTVTAAHSEKHIQRLIGLLKKYG